MRRASARSSTTTSARPRGRILAIDWPVAVLAAAAAVALAFDDGGYFPPAWGWSALALFWVAGLALFLRDRFSVGRLELAMLGAFAGFAAWVALSAAWSSSVERSILDAQRDLVYLGGLLAVLLVARRRPVTELLVAVCGAALVTSAFALTDFFLSAPCVVIFVVTIFLTYSRGTWIALAAGLATLAVVDARRRALLRVVATLA